MPIAVAALAPPHAVVLTAPTRWHPITVRPGDTIWQLAINNATTVRAIVEKNRLPRGGQLIHPGQKLLVPGAVTAPRREPGKGARPARPTPRTTMYTIRPGDTLSSIAVRHRIPLRALIAANRARVPDPSLVYAGQRIALPAGTAPTPPPKPAATSENTFAGYTYPDATVRAAKANRDALARRSVPSRTETANLIRRVAARHGVDPRLALAIAWQESGWNQRVVSVANAIGTMQLIPSSGRWAAELAGRRLDLLDTEDNVTAGVVILKALLHSAKDREQAVAGYYQGLASVRAHGLYEDTKGYVAAVLAHYRRM